MGRQGSNGRRGRSAAVAAATVALFCAAAPAGAARGTAPAYEPDVLSYADALGLAPAEAAERVGYQRPAGEVDQVLTERLDAAAYGGLWLQHEPVFRVVVAVTDVAAVPRVTELAAAVRPVLDVRVVARSLADLRTAAATGRATVRRLGFAVASGTDVVANRAVLSVRDQAAVIRALDRAGERLPDGVAFEEVAQLGEDEASLYGGLSLSSGSCTTGFAVSNSAGTRGVLTAGHCGNTQTWSGGSLTFRAERNSGDTDAQWHTASSTHTVQPWAHDGFAEPAESGYRSIRAVIGRGSQPVNGYVCKYGVTTGYTCGFISSKDFQPTNTSTTNPTATYIRVHRDGVNLSEGGDSGGPWFYGTDAYGIHKCGIGDDACYTAINYAQSALGVTVLTTAGTNRGWIIGGTTHLYPYDYMVSTDGRYVARMQNDGNFVLYKPGNVPVWATGTNSGPNAGATGRMQPDGNFVIYRTGATPVWATNTLWSGSTLELQNDCNLVVYAPGHVAVWASNTAGC